MSPSTTMNKTVPTLAPLTSVQFRQLIFESKIRVEPPGAIVYRRADFDNTFFSIIEGEVELVRLDNSDPTIPEELRSERRSL